MSAADGAALMAAAVRAAVLAKAPRRTVQAVAAAVAGALSRQQPAPRPRTPAREPAETPAAAAPQPGGSPEELLAAMREARRALRRKKKERMRTNRLLRAGAARAGAMLTDPPANSIAPVSSSAQTPSSPVTRLRRGEVLLALEDGSPVVEPPTKFQRGRTPRELADLPQVPLFPAGPALAAPASNTARGDDIRDGGGLASNSSKSKVTISTAPPRSDSHCTSRVAVVTAPPSSQGDAEAQPSAVFDATRGGGKAGRRRRKRA